MANLHLRDFLRALWAQWLLRWGGPVGVILAFATPYITTVEYQRIAIWTAAVVCLILACYGAWLVEHTKLLEFAPAPLAISIPPHMGETSLDRGSIYFHLKLTNPSKTHVTNCTVSITRIEKLVDGAWVEQPLPHDAQLSWQSVRPDVPERERTIIGDAFFDLGVIIVRPLFGLPFTFRPAFLQKELECGFLCAGETFRYHIRAEGIKGRMQDGKPAIVEVHWDGIYQPGQMGDHFFCKLVNCDGPASNGIALYDSSRKVMLNAKHTD
jgi:hypothetical protein